MSQIISRERRSWTAKEDQLLREAVQKEDPDNSNPSKWHAIAKHVPNRTNKDCRKRWFAKMASDVVKGGWAPDEDEKLVKGIERYGTRWSLVASVVQTRNSDQCAKRWTDTLNPAIDRTTWSSESDELLLRAVAEHGKVWTKIVKTYFPGRTGLSAKNRYNSITRFNSEISRTSRPRRKSPDSVQYISRKTESVSSSSSASPSTPAATLPFASSSYVDAKPYQVDSYSNWSSSSSLTTEDVPSFRSSPMVFDYSPDHTSPSTPSDSSYQNYELTMNNNLTTFCEPSHTLYPESGSPLPQPTQLFKPFTNNGHIAEPASSFSGYSHFPVVQVNNEVVDQFALFDGVSSVDSASAMNISWDPLSEGKNISGGFKAPPATNHTYSYVF